MEERKTFPQVLLLTLIVGRCRDNFGIGRRMKEYSGHFSVA